MLRVGPEAPCKVRFDMIKKFLLPSVKKLTKKALNYKLMLTDRRSKIRAASLSKISKRKFVADRKRIGSCGVILEEACILQEAGVAS